MRKIPLLTLLLFTWTTWIMAQNPQAYIIYDGQGNEVNFQNIIKASDTTDVMFFGELHNNAISHWLQLEVTKSLFASKNSQLILGAEMFERDAQLVLSEYLDGKIKESHLKTEGKAWNNYDTDYAPLVNFAKDHQLHFVASNVPRRYASLVARQGLESLEDLDKSAQKQYLPKLPIEVDMELPGYKGMLSMMGHMGHGDPEAGNRMVHAQAIKDATMAWSIAEAMKAQKNRYLLHFNGAYHSDNHEGIIWHLHEYAPKLKVVTITTVLQEDLRQLEDQYKGKADFIICVPSNMTQTYK